MKKVLFCFSLLFLLLTGCSNFNQVNCSLTIPVAFSALNKSIEFNTTGDKYGYIIARIDGEYNKTQVIDVKSLLIDRGSYPTEPMSPLKSSVNINFSYVPVGKKIKVSLILLSNRGQLGECIQIATSKDFVLSKNKNIVELTFDDDNSYDNSTVQLGTNKLFYRCFSNLGDPSGGVFECYFVPLGQSGLYGIYNVDRGGWVSIGHFEGTRDFGKSSYKFKEIAYKNSSNEFSSLQVVEKPKYNKYEFDLLEGVFVSNSGILFNVSGQH